MKKLLIPALAVVSTYVSAEETRISSQELMKMYMARSMCGHYLNLTSSPSLLVYERPRNDEMIDVGDMVAALVALGIKDPTDAIFESDEFKDKKSGIGKATADYAKSLVNKKDAEVQMALDMTCLSLRGASEMSEK